MKAMIASGWAGLVLSVALAGSALAADQPTPGGIKFDQRGDGAILSTPQGMTLYTFARDQAPGKSACNGGCAKLWPPFAAAADAAAAGEWTLIARDDGTHQWAFRGKPLYTYSKDVTAGDSYGDDVGAQWHVAFRPIFTPPEVSVTKTLEGAVLATPAGLTLYTSDRDKGASSSCDDACAHTWLPVAAPESARTVGDWSVVTREDGTRQWAYKGKALYAYAPEFHIGSTAGDGIDKTWRTAVLQPPAPTPGWVKVHESDAGELLTDARGHTLYQHAPRPRGPAPAGPEEIGSDSVPNSYKAVTVAQTEDAKPIGNWSIVDQNGAKQWAYKGLPLYTNDLDEQPGDLKGIRGSDRSFHTIMRSGEPMQGTGQ